MENTIREQRNRTSGVQCVYSRNNTTNSQSDEDCNTPGTELVCDPCMTGDGQRKKPAVERCNDCDENYCNDCAKQHSKFKRTRDHDLHRIQIQENIQSITNSSEFFGELRELSSILKHEIPDKEAFEKDESHLFFGVQAMKIGRPFDRAMIVLMGQSGSGKSETMNKFFECENLSFTHSSRSATESVTEYGIMLNVEAEKLKAYLSLVDVPGTFDTDEAKRNRNFASVLKFRNEHQSLNSERNSTPVYPNLVLITVSAGDDRIGGKDSFFNQTLKNIKLSNLVDKNKNNLIIAVTHCAYLGIPSDIYRSAEVSRRNLIARLVYDVFGLVDVKIVFIENKPEQYGLQKKENCDFYSLPDGELSHKNLFSAIINQLKANGDNLGLLLTSWFFKRDCPEKKEKPKILGEYNVATNQDAKFHIENAYAAPNNDNCDELQIELIGRGYCPLSENRISETIYNEMKMKKKTILGRDCALPKKIFIQDMEEHVIEDRMTLDTREDYQGERGSRYNLESDLKIILDPEVTCIGRWDVDNSLEENQVIVSFTREIRLVTVELPKRSSGRVIVPDFIKELFSCGAKENTKIDEYFKKCGICYVKKVSIGGTIQLDFSVLKAEINEIKAEIFNKMPLTLDELAKPTLSLIPMQDRTLENIFGKCIKIKLSGGDSRYDIESVRDLQSGKFARWIESLKKFPIELKHSIELQPYYEFAGSAKDIKRMKDATIKYLENDRNSGGFSRNGLADDVIIFVRRNNKKFLLAAIAAIALTATAGAGYLLLAPAAEVTAGGAVADAAAVFAQAAVVLGTRVFQYMFLRR